MVYDTEASQAANNLIDLLGGESKEHNRHLLAAYTAVQLREIAFYMSVIASAQDAQVY